MPPKDLDGSRNSSGCYGRHTSSGAHYSVGCGGYMSSVRTIRRNSFANMVLLQPKYGLDADGHIQA